jgi:hypothetical protein
MKCCLSSRSYIHGNVENFEVMPDTFNQETICTLIIISKMLFIVPQLYSRKWCRILRLCLTFSQGIICALIMISENVTITMNLRVLYNSGKISSGYTVGGLSSSA